MLLFLNQKNRANVQKTQDKIGVQMDAYFYVLCNISK